MNECRNYELVKIVEFYIQQENRNLMFENDHQKRRNVIALHELERGGRPRDQNTYKRWRAQKVPKEFSRENWREADYGGYHKHDG